MKINELLENDDLGKFHKGLMAKVAGGAAAAQAMHNAMFKHYKWKYQVGDMLLSKKTGKVLTITAQSSQKTRPRDENGIPIKGAEQVLVPIYRYEAGEEKGTLLAQLITPGMYSVVGKAK